MRELASILLARGMTPRDFSELSRLAFVQAAAARSKLRNGRVNHSRVAAQTGLTRADVKRLLARNSSDRPIASHFTPVARVVEGWRTDRRYLDRAGNPKSIGISGPKQSFVVLAKKYAGDVPYRAVLNELLRSGAATMQDDKLQLRTSAQLRKLQDLGSLAVVLPALVDGLRIAATKGTDANASVHRLLIPAQTDLDLTFLRDRCTASTRAMLEGLEHSLGAKTQSHVRRTSEKTWASFAVTVLLTEDRIKKSHEQKSSRSRSTANGH